MESVRYSHSYNRWTYNALRLIGTGKHVRYNQGFVIADFVISKVYCTTMTKRSHLLILYFTQKVDLQDFHTFVTYSVI